MKGSGGMSVYIDKMTQQLRDNMPGAICQLEQDDAAGNLEATYLLGSVYYDGLLCPPDSSKTLPLWEKGARLGNLNCLRGLGDCYFFGFGYTENNEKAMEVYRSVLKKNSNDSIVLCQIGRMYGRGWGVQTDIPQAMDYLEESWKKGFARAATEIGMLYMFSKEKTVENIKAAIKWFQRGADHGDVKGCYRLGLIYKWGDYGLPESPKIAYQYLRQARSLSDSLSLLITSEGCGVASKEEMQDLWAEAERRAEYGDSELEGALGRAYANGIGVPEDADQAAYWYERAAAHGNTFAEYQYGMKFALGVECFPVDYCKAYKHLTHAAEAGQEIAMKPLADLLFRREVPGISGQDRFNQMLYWYEQAVEHDDEWAAVSLGRNYEFGYAPYGCAPLQPNVEKAIYYYQIAADKEVDMVYFPLGKLYLQPSAATNYKLAHRYLSLAETVVKNDSEKAEIEYCYGKMSKEGLGIPRNLEEAHEHFVRAAAGGNAAAEEELKHLKKGFFGWKLI